MNKRDVWAVLFIYFISGEIIWTFFSMSLHWTIWLLGQPVLAAISMLIVGVTVGGRHK
jgi:hypothetical protein